MQQTGPARKATAMTINADEARYNQIQALHELANWLTANPDVPITYGVQVSLYCSMADARAIRATSLGGWQKVNEEYSSYIEYVQTFTHATEIPAHKAVSYSLLVSKRETCERVQVGTRLVEATEAREEPVYEWKCQR